MGRGPGRRWTAHTRADGSRIEFRYNRAGLKVATVDPLGQPISIESPDDQRWQITRNDLGHPLDVTGPEGTTE